MKITKFRIDGLKELEKLMLKELPAATSRRAVLGAMRESAKPMRDTAKSKVKKRSGALAESIGIKTVPKGRSKSFASIVVSPMSGNMMAWAKYLAHYKRSINLAGKGGSLDTGKIGRIRHGHLVEFGFKHRSGKHVPARPFLRPAADQETPTYIRGFRGFLKKRVHTAITKSRLKR